MKSKLRNKLIASLMLTVFMATNTVGAGFAAGEYIGYNAGRPSIRSAETG